MTIIEGEGNLKAGPATVKVEAEVLAAMVEMGYIKSYPPKVIIKKSGKKELTDSKKRAYEEEAKQQLKSNEFLKYACPYLQSLSKDSDLIDLAKKIVFLAAGAKTAALSADAYLWGSIIFLISKSQLDVLCEGYEH